MANTRGVVALFMLLLLMATACAPDIDPELTLLPEETVPTTAPVDAGDVPLVTSTTTSSTTVVPATTTPGRVGSPRLVTTDLGEVVGRRDDGVVSFLAVPYAAPPTGPRRFKPPEPATPWEERLTARTAGSSCPQLDSGIATQFFPAPPHDEDCLTLDVYAPLRGDSLPVMVWFHGGGFIEGSGHTAVYDGSNLARKDVVVVNINYRLGALGFLVTDETVRDAGAAPFGNLGLQDQIAALEWVQRNITQFGGDASNVTIFGQSAGAFSVCAHLAADASSGLFHRAIMQSGGGCDRFQTIDEAVGMADEWIAQTRCANARNVTDCLTLLSVQQILDASETAAVDFGVIADGALLDRTAFSLARTDELGAVPLLLGSNLDEGTLFTFGQDEPSDSEFRDELLASLGSEQEADLLLSQYEIIEDNATKLATFFTDSRFACPAVRFANEAFDDTTVYTYEFVHRSVDTPFGLGATHGAEVVYLFGNPQSVVGVPEVFNEVDAGVADFIQTAWASFARTGSPISDPAIDWPQYVDSAPAHLLIGAEPEVASLIRDGRCAIFDAAQQN
ncbi:MAG: carboxylesterase family protein [Acidimicrobiales bacterium]